MPTFYISMTASVTADSFEEANTMADEAVSHIEDTCPYVYDTNHWNIEQDEFEE